MLQIKNLTITHKKDLRVILEDFRLVLNAGDKAVLIGEEGNGKSTLLKWVYDPLLVEAYAECEGERIAGGESFGYLPQEMPGEDKEKTVYEFFAGEEAFFDKTPKELSELSAKVHLGTEFFYREQRMGSLSGGEKIKAQLMRIFLKDPTVLLLDEPSNDIDIDSLEWLEKVINGWKGIVLFISHDETLIEHTANMVIHLEQIKRKTKSRYTVAKMPYQQYVKDRLQRFEKQEQLAENERREKKIRDEKFQRIQQSVQYTLENTKDSTAGRLLKKKMHAVKALEKRFEREDENMTEMPEWEEAIFFKLGDKNDPLPAGKTVLDFSLERLMTPDGERILSEGILLRVRGPEKICISGDNGAGKTTLLRMIAGYPFKGLRVEYMPQNYEELLDLGRTPIDFLDKTGDKEERTKIRTYLGSLKFTADEMDHPVGELSGGQKAKVLLLKYSLSAPDVLILDEPTRNFSPLSGPVIRRILKEFPGAIISISHDRKYMEEVCDKVYRLTRDGLVIMR